MVSSELGYFTACIERDTDRDNCAAICGRIVQVQEYTADGKKSIRLYVNIGSVADTAAALANDEEEIGLFRSEFLYLEASDYPTEEEQFKVYMMVAQNMGGSKYAHTLSLLR